jgi:anti-anti-sigma factor
MQAVSVRAPQQVVQRSIPLLERQIDELIAGRPQALELDLSQLQVIDSTGLNWLLSQLARLESLNVCLVLSEPSPLLMDVLVATRLDTRFRIQSSAAAGGDHGRG